MSPKSDQIKHEKPFRLVKAFTASSLLLIFIGTVVISAMNIRYARRIQLEKSKEYALALVENLNHQVFLQFIVPVALRYGRIQLREPDQFERLDKVVRATLHSFKIDAVHIFDMSGIVSYSFDQALIGKTDLGGQGYQRALEGYPNSVLKQIGSFWQIYLGIPKKSLMVTFAPLRAEKLLSTISGPVVGVVEIVQDITEEYRRISHYQTLIIATSALVMGVLFFALRFMVKRGEEIIEQRALERLRLEEQLARAKHFSSLGEMTAGISHEIRNPLGIIRSSADLLAKKMAQLEPGNQMPAVIVEETRRLDNIITDFLNYARPRPPNLTNCQVIEVIEKNLDFLKPQLMARGYTVIKDFSEPLPTVTADTDMLYQAFLNILINAMQAMPDGGVIRIRAMLQGRLLAICFDDEGQGVAEEQMEKVLDPFFTTKPKGSGLGLGIVKNIIEVHEGELRLSNRSEGGLRVEVRLPSQAESAIGQDQL